MNAELHGTLGPLLKDRADRAGAAVSYTDGDEPGLILNLSRYARAVGLEPVLAGNLKGLLDPYRTPDTQREFAAAVGQKERMVTSFADGTKLSLEAAITANALGFGVARRGMTGHRCEHVNEAAGLFDAEELLRGGIVDFLLGAQPGSGVRRRLRRRPRPTELSEPFQVGDGPLYTFYQPWHLPNFDVPLTVARRSVPRRRRRSARLAPLRGRDVGQARPAGGHVPRRDRRLRLLRNDRERRRRQGGEPAPDGPRRGLPARRARWRSTSRSRSTTSSVRRNG